MTVKGIDDYFLSLKAALLELSQVIQVKKDSLGWEFKQMKMILLNFWFETDIRSNSLKENVIVERLKT